MANLDIGQAQGSGINGAVAIPLNAPRIPVPSARGPGALEVPNSVSAVPALFQGMAGVSEKLGTIFAAQQANRDALTSANLQNSYELADAQAKADALQNGSSNPADEKNIVGLYKTASEQAMATALADPTFAGMSKEAQTRTQIAIQRAQAQGHEEMILQLPARAAAEQNAQLEDLKKSGASVAAQDYRIEANGSVGDGPKALARDEQVQGAIAAMFPHKPLEAQHQFDLYMAEKTLQRAQAIAQDTTQPFLLNRFIKAQPVGTFTPEQLQHFTNVQIAAIETPYHLATANHEAQQANAIADLDKLAATHDPTLGAKAYSYKLNNLIDGPQYEAYTHSKWRDPAVASDPGLVDSYIKDIQANPYKFSGPDITALATMDPNNPHITPADLHKLQAVRYDAERKAKTAVGGEYDRSAQLIREAFTPRAVNVNPALTAEKIAGAVKDLHTPYIEGRFETAQEVIDARNRIIKEHLAGQKMLPPMIHTIIPPRAIPPELAARIRRDGMAVGFDPTGGD